MTTGIEYLQKLGLTLYQARAATLLFKRDATAKEISSLMDIPLPKVYQVLDSLKGRGIALEYFGGRPRVYKKLSAKRTINRLLGRRQKEVELLSEGKPLFIEYLGSLHLRLEVSQCPTGRHELRPGEFCFCSTNEKGVIENAYKR